MYEKYWMIDIFGRICTTHLKDLEMFYDEGLFDDYYLNNFINDFFLKSQ